MGLGIPLGIWWCWRSRNLLLFAVLALVVVCMVPRIFLDWGYRSTDFLRFFTESFSFAALIFGCWVGRLLGSPGWRRRALGLLFVGATLTNAVGLAILGSMPGTLAVAKAASTQGLSLSQLASPPISANGAVAPTSLTPAGKARSAFAPPLASNATREEAFTNLAKQLDDFLFPIAHGQDRAIVIVAPSVLPPLSVFPEWMKLATLGRVVLPVGWHWDESIYSAYYRAAVQDLNANATTALNAHWVIVTNLWDYPPPAKVVRALNY